MTTVCRVIDQHPAIVIGQMPIQHIQIFALAINLDLTEVLRIGLIEKIAGTVAGAIEPRDDHRASGDYRRHLIEVMVSRAFADAAGEAGIEIAD